MDDNANTQLAKLEQLDDKALLALVSGGDTSRLNETQKIAYYRARCEAAGLDSRTAPLMYVRLSGKETLYATKGATDQLASNHGIVLSILSQETEDGVRLVKVRATAKDGRSTEEVGALSVEGLKGEMKANALMKCVTKAKRRAILSLCGLGMLDETEVESVTAMERDEKPAREQRRAAPETARGVVAEVMAKTEPVEPPYPVPTGEQKPPPQEEEPHDKQGEIRPNLADELIERMDAAKDEKRKLNEVATEVKNARAQERITEAEYQVCAGRYLQHVKAIAAKQPAPGQAA